MSQEAFSRAFKRQCGTTPGEYRRRVRFLPIRQPAAVWPPPPGSRKGDYVMEPRFEEHRAFTVAGMEYFGDNANDEIAAMWGRFDPLIASITARTGDPSVYYGVCDNMNEKGEFRYIAAVEVAEDAPIPDGLVRQTIPAGRYAVFTHHGSLEGLKETFRRIYSEWLPATGCELRHAPDFERYDERFKGFAPGSELDIYVPVV